MFTFDQLKELIDLVASRDLKGLEIERSGFRLKITGRSEAGSSSSPPSSAKVLEPAEAPSRPAAVVVPEPAAKSSTAAEGKEGDDDSVHILHSPIVGTFYVAPSPDADPFVRIGDRVKRGQIVCIVEAMKLMNEIEADVDGTIRAVLPDNAQPVEYGQPLFAIEVA